MKRYKWLIALAGILGFLYLTKAVLLPFMAGLAVAYFLDPVADALEKRNVPRGAASALVLGVFFFLIVGMVLAVWPVLQSQLGAVSEMLPETLAGLRPWLNEQVSSLSTFLDIPLDGEVDSFLATAAEAALTQMKNAAGGILKGSLALFNLFSLLLITPVVAFYLLRDWDVLVARIDSLLPQENKEAVRRNATEIDTVLAGFVRGQILVCLVMGALYALGWSLVGLKFGLVLGVLAGILAFIPFIGALFALGMALAIGIGQWGFEPLHLGLVAVVYLFVQTIEGAFLTPRLVGERVGLHPVWVLFAVFAGGEILGFVGVLIAVPASAAIAVLVRYGAYVYLLDEGHRWPVGADVPVRQKAAAANERQTDGKPDSSRTPE